MVDFHIDDIDDEMMSRIETTARAHALTAEMWAREVIIAFVKNRELNFAQALASESSIP